MGGFERLGVEIEGDHPWVELHLDETGWLPIDAAEASKHPEKRELFSYTQPADRTYFTAGLPPRNGIDRIRASTKRCFDIKIKKPYSSHADEPPTRR